MLNANIRLPTGSSHRQHLSTESEQITPDLLAYLGKLLNTIIRVSLSRMVICQVGLLCKFYIKLYYLCCSLRRCCYNAHNDNFATGMDLVGITSVQDYNKVMDNS